MHKFFISLFIVLYSHSFVQAQADKDTAFSSILVAADSCMFGVKEPKGYHGDVEQAQAYYANIIFYKSAEDVKNGGALIQVYAYSKTDEQTDKDLASDVKRYETKYPKLKKQDLSSAHPTYKTYAKLVYVEGDFYQYTVYLNPGPKYKKGLSVSMNISKRKANGEELKAFQTIISSLMMM